MKKGFTLIELLAVIIILAIIALIVTPIVIVKTNISDVTDNISSYFSIDKNGYGIITSIVCTEEGNTITLISQLGTTRIVLNNNGNTIYTGDGTSNAYKTNVAQSTVRKESDNTTRAVLSRKSN